MEQELLPHFPAYRRIWVQYTKFSTCVTLFPVNTFGEYTIVTAPQKIQNVNGLVELIQRKAC